MEKTKNNVMKEFLKSSEFIAFFDEITEATSLFAVSTSEKHHMAVMQGTNEEIVEALIYVLHNKPEVFKIFMEAIARSIVTPLTKLTSKDAEEQQYMVNAHQFLLILEATTQTVIRTVNTSVKNQAGEIENDLNL